VVSKAKRFRWWLEYGLLYALFMVSRIMPRPVLFAWGRLLGRVAFHILRIRRGVALDNLRAAFGSEMTEREIHSLAARFYANLGLTLMEFFTLYDLSRQQILQKVTVEGIEHLEACRRQGRGALLLSGHLGNWELAGAAMSARGYPVSYLIKSQSNPYVDRMQNEIRRRAGVGVIRQGASVRQLVYALRRHEIVGILGDQDGGNQGLFIDFLGRPASVFRGPAYMAYRTGCPVIPGGIVREEKGKHRVILTPPIDIDPSWDEETAVAELSRAHTQRLADLIRKYPDQYFWVHRRWKTQPSS
jgi:KDO2-lipid IV(A) lauroyltransferase